MHSGAVSSFGATCPGPSQIPESDAQTTSNTQAIQRTGPIGRKRAYANTRPHLEDLTAEADSLIAHSLAKNCWKTYKTALESFYKLRLEYGLLDSWPAQLDELINFIAYLSLKSISPSTISAYISGISYAHKIRGLGDRTHSFIITKMLEGLRRRSPAKLDLRTPVSISLLQKIISALPSVWFSHFEACLFSSVFSLSFFALLRVGEITTESKSVLGPHVICRQDVNFNVIDGRLELQLRIRSSKADQRQNSVTLIIPEQDTELCAVKILHNYLNMREPSPLSPLFLHFDGSYLTRFQFNAILRKTLQFCGVKDHIRSHSFRIGGTSELARKGVLDNDIQKWGRWASDAYSSYIRLNFFN